MPAAWIGDAIGVAAIEEGSASLGVYGKVRPMLVSKARLEAAGRGDGGISPDRQSHQHHDAEDPGTDFGARTRQPDSLVPPALAATSQIERQRLASAQKLTIHG